MTLNISLMANSDKQARRAVLSRSGLLWTAVVAGLLVLPFMKVGAFTVSIATTVLITGIAAASLHLIIRMGHVSLAHAAFAGIGAYAGVIAAMRFGLPPPLTFVVAFLAPALVALLFGPILLRWSPTVRQASLASLRRARGSRIPPPSISWSSACPSRAWGSAIGCYPRRSAGPWIPCARAKRLPNAPACPAQR
jgi:hypothetical protein